MQAGTRDGAGQRTQIQPGLKWPLRGTVRIVPGQVILGGVILAVVLGRVVLGASSWAMTPRAASSRAGTATGS